MTMGSSSMTTGVDRWRFNAGLVAVLKAALVGLIMAVATGTMADAATPRSFASPEAAAKALIEAARNADRDGVLAILGAESEEWIASGDPVQDKADATGFIAAYDQKNGIEKIDEDFAFLLVGDDDYPFAIPLVKGEAGWFFDAEEGRQELLNRRIGRNELDAIQTIQAVADAQFEYASVDWDGNGTLEYAAYIVSSDGARDGLWWPSGGTEPQSPLGPLVADAVREGYIPEPAGDAGDVAEDAQGGDTAEAEKPVDVSQPYHGYHYRLLTRQGASAPGGALDYFVDGRMVGGFAVLAYPANYDNSGIMTFIISHDGTVYDRDLGPETDELVLEIDSFDPGEGWEKVEAEFTTQ